MICISAPDDFEDKAREALDGHMLGEPIVVDPVIAIFCIFNNFWIFLIIEVI